MSLLRQDRLRGVLRWCAIANEDLSIRTQYRVEALEEACLRVAQITPRYSVSHDSEYCSALGRVLQQI